MEQKPSDSALTFEAIKLGMTQDKNGVVLKLSVHPQDCPPQLHTDWVGARYQIAMVRLEDDGTPTVREDKVSAKKAVAMAGMLCQEPKFQAWLWKTGISTEPNEEGAAEALRHHLLVKSRSELATDEKARKKFYELKASFEADLDRGEI
jgi:hypothetical protein